MKEGKIMKKGSGIFWGVIFIISSLVGFVQYGVAVGIVCLAIGVALIFYAFRHSSSDPAENEIDSAVVSDAMREHGLDDNCIRCTVAGVSFKNDDGSDRQYILRKIFFRDPPYNAEIMVSITPYDFNGETAFGVYVNSKQIGNVPKQYVQRLIDDNDRLSSVENFNVYGGGKDDDGSQKNFGASLDIIFE